MTAHAGYHYTSTGAVAPFEADTRASCRAPAVAGVFFAPDGERPGAARRRRIAAAKAVCKACPLRTDCADWALSTGQGTGIYGGLTEEERAERQRIAQQEAVAA